MKTQMILSLNTVRTRLFAANWFGLADVLTNIDTAEVEGRTEPVQHGALPSLSGGEWPGRCGLYCDGQSVMPAP
jgi:hypothetical protein